MYLWTRKSPPRRRGWHGGALRCVVWNVTTLYSRLCVCLCVLNIGNHPNLKSGVRTQYPDPIHIGVCLRFPSAPVIYLSYVCVRFVLSFRFHILSPCFIVSFSINSEPLCQWIIWGRRGRDWGRMSRGQKNAQTKH